MSRGAASVVFVDTGAEARGLIRDNIEAFGLGGVAKLLRRDATDLGPAGTMGGITLAFLDPPYGKGLGEQALVQLRDGNWLAPDATIVLEEVARRRTSRSPRASPSTTAANTAPPRSTSSRRA